MNPTIEAISSYADPQGTWAIEAVPTEHTWRRLASVKLLQRRGHLQLPGCAVAFLNVAEMQAGTPAFAAEADAALIDLDRQWTRAEIGALETELANITPEQWGLTKAQQQTAAKIAGVSAWIRTGNDHAAFDPGRERASLELATGTLALAGYIADIQRQRQIETALAAARTKLASLTTPAERAAAERKRLIAESKKERAALAKRETATA
jgi:hypothetical protein